MNLPQLLTYTRQLINDVDSVQVDDATLMLYENESYGELWNKLCNMNEDFGVTFLDVSTTQFTDMGGGLLGFFLPPTLQKVIRVERDDGNGGRVALIPISIGEKDYYYNQTTRISGNFGCYFLFGQRIGLRSDTPAASLRIYYTRRWPYLQSGLAQATFAAGTLVFPAVPTLGDVSQEDDYYNDAIVRIVAGTGAGQERRIADYAGASRTCTMQTNWTTVPDGTSQYSLMPELPENHHKMLAYMSAEVFCIRKGNEKQLGIVRGMREEIETEMGGALKPRQDQEPREVIDELDSFSE